ncbi:MAG: TetR/AcrR family transcriptional regulator [Bermanella sp.]
MTTLSARKKAAIVDAAIDIFQKNGFQGSSMDAIAQQAQVSKRTVYNHFPSKQALFEHIAQSVWESANQATVAQFDAQQNIEPQLRVLAMQELALVGDAGFLRLSRVLMAEFIHEPSMAQAILERFNKEESSLTQWMQKASQHPQLTIGDAEQAGGQFHGLIKAQAFWPQIMFGQESIPTDQHEQLAKQVCTMFLSVYGKGK